jgi:hypothetical protein
VAEDVSKASLQSVNCLVVELCKRDDGRSDANHRINFGVYRHHTEDNALLRGENSND